MSLTGFDEGVPTIVLSVGFEDDYVVDFVPTIMLMTGFDNKVSTIVSLWRIVWLVLFQPLCG